MKRLVAVCSIIFFLSFPALAGHSLPGFGWCDCDNPGSHYQGLTIEDEEDSQLKKDGAKISEIELYTDTILLLLRSSF